MFKYTLIAVSLALTVSACQSLPKAPEQNIALLGTWHVDSIKGVKVADYSPAQFTFDAEGNLTGNNSCNNFFGSYTLKGSSLTLFPAGSTMKACVDSLMQQEQQVLNAMTEVSHAQLNKGKLILKNNQNKVTFTLSK